MVGQLEIKGVTKRFPREKEEDLVALNGVKLEIKAGSFVSLIEPSGCGKSTLLRLIAGLEGFEKSYPHQFPAVSFPNIKKRSFDAR